MLEIGENVAGWASPVKSARQIQVSGFENSLVTKPDNMEDGKSRKLCVGRSSLSGRVGGGCHDPSGIWPGLCKQLLPLHIVLDWKNKKIPPLPEKHLQCLPQNNLQTLTPYRIRLLCQPRDLRTQEEPWPPRNAF